MKCRNCGSDNDVKSKFCEKCGSNLGGNNMEKNNKIKFDIVDMFKTILDSILHPMKAFDKLNNESIANCGIYAGFLLLITTIFNVLVFVIYCATKDIFKYKIVKTGDVFSYGFSILGYLVLFIALAAFIYKVASLFMKKDIEFKKIITGVLVGFTTLILSKYIITIFALFLNDKFFMYLFSTINIFTLLYSIFYTIKIVTKDFGSDSEKGILLNIICLTILFALSTFVLADWFTTLTKFFSAGIFTI